MKFSHQNRRNAQERKQRGKPCRNKQCVTNRNAPNSAKLDECEETPIHGKHDAVKHAEMSPCFHCRYSEPGTVHMCPGVRCAKYKAWKHTYLQQR